MKKVMTVLGAVVVSELGVTSMHEHLLLDTRCWFKEPSEPTRRLIAHQKLSLDNLGYVWRNPFSIKDNMILDDVDLAVSELTEFKKAGGNTIVDVTNVGLGRDPLNTVSKDEIDTIINVLDSSITKVEKVY